MGGLTGSQSGDTMAAALGAVIVANGAQGLKISGTGTLQGRAKEFMKSYDEANEWWLPGGVPPEDVCADGVQGPGGARYYFCRGAELGAAYAGLRRGAGG